jgi:hypothetical protein
VGCLPISLREAVVQAFADVGIIVQAIYPNVGNAGASLNGQLSQTCGVFECQSGALGYTRLTSGRTASTRVHFNDERANLADSCIELMDGEVDSLWLAGRWPNVDEVAGKISSRTGRSCQKIPLETEALSPSEVDACAFAGMVGAFRHFVRLASKETAVSITAHVPSISLKEYKYYRQGVFLLFTSILCVIGGGVYQLKCARLSNLAEARIKLEEVQTKINTLETELKNLNQRKNFLNEKLPQREALLPDLMGVLQSVTPKEIMLNSFYEDDAGIIHVDGWGLSVRTIQLFKLDISERLAGFRIDSKNYPIREEKGWRGLKGYSFQFDLLPEGVSLVDRQPEKARGRH